MHSDVVAGLHLEVDAGAGGGAGRAGDREGDPEAPGGVDGRLDVHQLEVVEIDGLHGSSSMSLHSGVLQSRRNGMSPGAPCQVGVHLCAMTDRYRRVHRAPGRRARRVAETRRRIVEAAVELHTTVGPPHTTISGIAERAGVQRHTVYAHFPDEADLFAACTGLWEHRNPFPDVGAWAAIEDPRERLSAALHGLYAFYSRSGADLVVVFTGAEQTPSMRRSLADRAQQLRRDRGGPRPGPRRARAAAGPPAGGARARGAPRHVALAVRSGGPDRRRGRRHPRRAGRDGRRPRDGTPQ